MLGKISRFSPLPTPPCLSIPSRSRLFLFCINISHKFWNPFHLPEKCDTIYERTLMNPVKQPQTLFSIPWNFPILWIQPQNFWTNYDKEQTFYLIEQLKYENYLIKFPIHKAKLRIKWNKMFQFKKPHCKIRCESFIGVFICISNIFTYFQMILIHLICTFCKFSTFWIAVFCLKINMVM